MFYNRGLQLNFMRIFISLGSGFFGLIFLIAGLGLFFTDKVELSATNINIETVDTNNLPEAFYLNITGGYLYFPAAQYKLDSENKLDFILAPHPRKGTQIGHKHGLVGFV